jgi:hypothetical protein
MNRRDHEERWVAGWLEMTLKGRGAQVAREVSITGGGRIDLVVAAEYTAAVEVKRSRDRQALCTALGQALSYRNDGYDRVAVAIPVAAHAIQRGLAQEMVDTYEAAGVQIVELDMRPGAFTKLGPFFPYLYETRPRCGYPWGRLLAS